VPVVALLGLARPVLGGLATEIINAARGYPMLDTAHDMLFPPNRTWESLRRAARQHFAPRVVAVRALWAVLWIVAVFQLGFNAAGVSVREVWLDWRFWGQIGLVLAAAVLIFLLVVLYLVAVGNVAEPVRRFLAARRLRQAREQRPYEPVTEETVSGTLALSPVCQRLPPPERNALVGQLKPAIHRARERLTDFDQPPPKEMWLIVSGAVDVFRRTATGRPDPAWCAVEGDLVGAETLLEPRPGGWRLQARTPLVTLAVPAALYAEKIQARIEAPVLHGLAHRVPFLRQNRLCRGWHPQALARFATMSTLVKFADRDYVLHRGQENQRLFVIYEGNVRISRLGITPRQAGPGELLGEIGMLQNGVASADVIAVGQIVCLCLDKADFLHFLVHNYEVALEVERVSSKRLGRPIFPMSEGSFDIL
jgi:CRP-like cAMP-binding protein